MQAAFSYVMSDYHEMVLGFSDEGGHVKLSAYVFIVCFELYF